MDAHSTVAMARKYANGSSAELALHDATCLLVDGNHDAARFRALKSLAYSIGITHPDYIAAAAPGSSLTGVGRLGAPRAHQNTNATVRAPQRDLET